MACGCLLAAELGEGRPGTRFQLLPSSSPVPYDICRPDHSVLTLHLPVTASVREVMAALAHEDHWTKGQVLVKVNSAGGELCLWMNSALGEHPQIQSHSLEFRPSLSRLESAAGLSQLLWLFQKQCSRPSWLGGFPTDCGSRDGACERSSFVKQR